MTNRTKTQFLTSTAIAMVFTNLQISPAHANPEGGTIKSGEAVITTPDTKTLEINQNSQNVIIDWKRFDIKAGETTRFVQPNSEAWALNRVVGSTDPSHIHGSLEANGNVIIVNPDGIHFGSESRVDVNRLIATTHDISNNNFMAGKYVFDLPGNPSASIVNEGDISIADYGLSAFVAPSVRNSGTITAKFGQINLASGNQFTIDPYGDGLIKLAIDDEITSKIYDVATGKQVSDLVKNDGVLKADGGIVALSATTARQVVNSVVNNTGIIEANSIGTKNGKIILGAQTSKTKIKTAQRQKVKVSGKINSTAYPIPSRITVPTPNPRRGGRIEIMGEEIEMASALLDVSGVNGGGTVLIGGDYKGGNGDAETIARYRIELENQEYSSATWLSADEQTLIKANALSLGNGGKVILWSDETTNTAADIYARGGSTSGNGGFVETSGKQDLISTGFVNAGAVNGLAGTWLLDPTDVIVNTNDVSLTLNNGTSVDITASNRIDINGSISKTSGGNAKLDLRAGNYIAVNLGAVSTSGELDIFMSAPTIDGRFDKINTNGGDVTLELNQVDYTLGFNNFKTEGGDLSVSSSHNLSLDSLNVNTGGGDIDMSSNSHIIARSTNIELGGGTAKFSAEEVGFCRPACSNISADPNFEYDQSAYRNLTGTSISNPFGGLIKNGILKVIIDGVDPTPVTPPTPIDNKPTVGSNTINQITYENGNTGLNQSNISNLFSDDGGTQNLTITFMGVPTGVIATANADGSVSFTSNSEVDLPVGNHSITISAKDNSGQSVSRSITLNVSNPTPVIPPAPIDNKPTVGSNTINQITYENGNTGLNQSNISNLFSDDGGTQNLTITFMGVPTGVIATANADGSVSFTSNSGVDLPVGNHSITISAKDNSGQSVSRSISLNVSNSQKPQNLSNLQSANLWNAGEELIMSLTISLLDGFYNTFQTEMVEEQINEPTDEFPSYGSVAIGAVTDAFFEVTRVPGGEIISAALDATELTLTFKTHQFRVRRIVHDRLVNEVYGLSDNGGNIYSNLRELITLNDNGYLKSAYTRTEKILLEQFVISILTQRVTNGELDEAWVNNFISHSIDIESLGY